MKLFIDANAYLNFLRLSNDRTSALSSFLILVRAKKVILVFPKITIEEYLRNRDKVIENSRLALVKLKNLPSVSLPPPVKGGIKILEEKRKNYLSELEKIEKKYVNSVKLIKEKIDTLFKYSIHPDETESLYQAALRRRERGNPPGKSNGTIGDELVWELLLSDCHSDDLAIVSGDTDWFLNLNGKKVLHNFLIEEWRQKSKKNISFFETVGEFVNSLTKQDTVSKEKIKEEKISLSSVGALSWDEQLGRFVLSDQSLTGPLTLSNISGATWDPNVDMGNLISSSFSILESAAETSFCLSCGRSKLSCICGNNIFK